MKLPKYLITVTPFSKGVALILYFIFPIVGFYLGKIYQKSITPQYRYEPRIIKQPYESVHDLVERCGKLPSASVQDYGHYAVVKGPLWSPDCRHVAWSVWMSGTGAPGAEMPAKVTGEGIYVYSDATAKVERIYTPSSYGMVPELIGWKDRNTIEYQTSGGLVEYTFEEQSAAE